jgi:hypothetical protein
VKLQNELDLLLLNVNNVLRLARQENWSFSRETGALPVYFLRMKEAISDFGLGVVSKLVYESALVPEDVATTFMELSADCRVRLRQINFVTSCTY